MSATKLRQIERVARESVQTLQIKLETEQAIKALKKSVPKSVDMAKSTGKLDSLDKANQTRKLSKQQAIHQTADLIEQHPDMTPTQIAAEIGKSRGTVYDYLRELKQHPNGDSRK